MVDRILNPKRLRGVRPSTIKPLPSQPQAQVQPMSENSQGFGFTFGGSGGNPTPTNSSFGFGSQQSNTPQQSTGFGFGLQQSIEPTQQSQGFNFNSNTPNLFQSSNSTFGSGTQPVGFQGSIFNIQPSAPVIPANQASPFNPFSSNINNTQGSTATSNNVFGNTPAQSAAKPLFNFQSPNIQREQAKSFLNFGQAAISNAGFGSRVQSTSAPSSFDYSADNAMTDEQPTTSSSFAFGTNLQGPATITAPAANSAKTATSLFSSGSRPDGQKSFSFVPQTNPSIPKSTATEYPSGVATGSAPAATTPLFNLPIVTKSPTTNMFASAAQSTVPKTSGDLKKPLFGASTGQSSNLFAIPSPMPLTSPSISMFGKPPLTNPQQQSQTIGLSNINNQSKGSQIPLFGVNPLNTTAKDTGENPSDTQSTDPKSSQNPGIAKSQAQEITQFPMTATGSATSIFNTEQKALPSFSFDNKVNSVPSLFKLPGEVLSGGSFQTKSTSGFNFQTTNGPSKTLFTSQPGSEALNSAFTWKSPESTGNAATPNPLLNNSTGSSSDPSYNETQITGSATKSSMFGATPSTVLTNPASEASKIDNTPKTSLISQSAIQNKEETTTLNPNFNFGPTSNVPQPKITTELTTHLISTTDSSSKTPFKPSISFKPETTLLQDISPNKSPFNFRPAVQKPKIKDPKGATSPKKPASRTMQPFDSSSASSVASTQFIDLDHPPEDNDIPTSLTAKWSSLRSGDLPMDETVDILLHDWILQLEIPDDAYEGLDMDQRDELTWLWQQNAVDDSWDFHIKELGDRDRNLLEVFRITLNLKEAVDHYHQKSWTKEDCLVDVQIFDERLIRQMAKRNIEAWENGLKSEIKNLKKRKADVHDDQTDESNSDNNKRSKVGDEGRSVRRKASLPLPAAPILSNGSNQPFIEDDSSDEGSNYSGTVKNVQKPFVSQIGTNPTQAIEISNNTSKAPKFSSFTSTTGLNNADSPMSPGHENEIKTNLFAAANTTSPQRSKTSQLFASIANKPVEPVASSTSTTNTTKSLFDRISRDSSGAPMRENINSSVSIAQEHDIGGEGDDEAEERANYEDEREEYKKMEGEGDDDDEAGDYDKDDSGDYVQQNEEDEDESEEQSDESEILEGESQKGSEPPMLYVQSTSTGADARETATGMTGDNTWKPDSPIRFSKAGQGDLSLQSPTKPTSGFVPTGGMPKFSTAATSNLTVSSHSSWQAPTNPLGFFKSMDSSKLAEVSDQKVEKRVPPATKFEMPKPLSNFGSDSGFTVSSHSSWQAPSNPFGFFKSNDTQQSVDVSGKKVPEEAVPVGKLEMPKPPPNFGTDSSFTVSSQTTWQAPSNPLGFFKNTKDAQTEQPIAPKFTLTAPSPQRQAAPLFRMGPTVTPKPAETTKAIYGFDHQPMSIETAKPLFGFNPQQKSVESSKPIFGSTSQPSMFGIQPYNESQPQPSIFSTSNPIIPMKGIINSVDESQALKKPSFDFSKVDSSSTPGPVISNGWLDFAKGVNKASSPAPSGASVFASLNTSLNPSRATSPAMSAMSTAAGDTDTDHQDDEAMPKEAQIDLGMANAGEENEDLLGSVRAKAYEFYAKGNQPKEWSVRGVGELRILRSRESGKVRVVLRADQTAKVLLNAGLLPGASYGLMSAKRVNFTVASANGVPSRWFLQVGKEDDARNLSEIFEENKAN